MTEKIQSLMIEGVFPADIYVRLVVSASAMNKVLDYLSAATLEYDGEEHPELKEADRFVTEEFFPMLNGLSEELKRGQHGS